MEVGKLKKALEIARSINLRICYVSMVSMFVLMVLTTINTIMRKIYFLGGIKDAFDMTAMLLVLIVFCAMAFLESGKGHVRVGMLFLVLPSLPKKIVEAFWYLMSSGILFLFTLSLFNNIQSTYKSGAASQVFAIPWWPFSIVITVAVLAYALTVLTRLIAIIVGQDSEKEQLVGDKKDDVKPSKPEKA